MRVPTLLLLACAATAASGCGGGDEPRAQKPLPAVELDVTAPADMTSVRSETVEVTGSVQPAGAAVLVLGQRAYVTGGGTFKARVPLEPGDNVIDVMASARGRQPALTALRVVRQIPVEVPDLDGMEVAEAQEAVGEVGLRLEVQESGGGIIDELLGGEPAVCEQDPEPGTDVDRGTTVHVVVSRSC